MRRKGYINCSEAFRDMLRCKLGEMTLEQDKQGHCITIFSYIYAHQERQLSNCLAEMQHDHHVLTVSTMHAHLSHDAAQTPSTLNYASTKDIQDINPHLYSDEMAAQNMMFESLLVNTDNGVQSLLAERWTISSESKTYTFHLRQSVTFSDGEPFNAQAVKLNIDAVLTNYQRHAW
ncbi:MAG: nickel-responsive transcriptional regulator NikR [Candidatus Malihini olakiniferum]